MKTNTTRFFLIAASLSMLIAVAAGAFGAHALRDHVSRDTMQIWQTAVLYQAIHSLALLVLGIAGGWKPELALRLPAWCFTAGILVFSGSLYALVLSEEKWLGAITPIGGVAFLAGWAWLAWVFWKTRDF